MASITKRRLKDGKVVYEIRVFRGRDPGTNKQLKPFSKRFHPPFGLTEEEIKCLVVEEAQRFERICRTEEQQKDRSAPSDPSAMTLSAFIDIFLSEVDEELAHTTVATYSFALAKFKRSFSDYKMDEITPQMIKGYLQRFQNGELDDYRPSANTVGQLYAVLKRLFGQAVEEGIIEKNPMLNLHKPRVKKTECVHHVEAYSEKEARYLIECLDKEPLKWRAFVLFLLDSGCRRGEAVALRWKDFKFESGSVVITNNAQYDTKHGSYITTPKNGRARIIVLNSKVLDVLKDWQKAQKMYYGESEFCFTGKDNNMMHPHTPTSYMAKLGKKYGIKDLHPHILRHTMASISIANGADVVSISGKLGHSNPSITLNVYSHVNQDAQRRANDLLAKALFENKEQPEG